ncbi:chromate transporter [Tahibacter aquaticus]|uniref:Chromate transporter n=1 Tax=Tahibacter aquaticus TaxID=520092 RepID=A0A4R6YPF6_9GAMM|nr:chromate efflux transporter [Tahibacter aquaticus]TDR39678.1 chromate transporter [Tahibacter aquaticus]
MPTHTNPTRHRWLDVFLAFLGLGLTSFGGPVAHLAYFRRAFVERRAWLTEAEYADLVALCQFLPGPASSQVGMALGLRRAGVRGALAAWVGFTLPSALLMIAAASGVAAVGGVAQTAWVHGLKLAAVAVVAHAVWTMGRQLCTGPTTLGIAVAAAAACIALPSAWAQLGAIAAGGLLGWLLLPRVAAVAAAQESPPYRRRWAVCALVIFAIGLLGLSPLAAWTGSHGLAVFDGFYRSGALVFGGGHVVLPLLDAETVGRGWLDADTFLAGYGVAQAVPGPLFTFAAFLGFSMTPAPNGWAGAAIALFGIFLPSFLLLVGTLPFWDQLRRSAIARAALGGINAAVVGLLAAAFYHPVLTGAVRSPTDAGIAAVGAAALLATKAPSWVVVGFCVAGACAVRALSGG